MDNNNFFKDESTSAKILFLAVILSILIANIGFANLYEWLFNSPLIHISIFNLTINSSLKLAINDSLMCLFFLLISLEIKRELVAGELNSLTKTALPMIAALGGMIVPAIIFLLLNNTQPNHLTGWAIPTATDIAFPLGILALLGKRIPSSLKIFLTSLAIIDDLGAILIIAVFYTQQIYFYYLLVAGLVTGLLGVINYFNIRKLSIYLILGFILWFCILKSGVHATISGVILGLLIPLKTSASQISPAQLLEKKLHSWVAYGILPLFAFANAGINFSSLSFSNLTNTLTLGCLLGLLIGKPLGIFFSSWLAVKTGIAELSSQANWQQLLGISILCGVGFTMSLFIATLAFGSTDNFLLAKLGVIIASFLAGVIGYWVLKSN